MSRIPHGVVRDLPNSCRSAVAKRRCRSTPLTALFATLKLWFFMRMIFAVILALLPLALIGNAQAAARGQFTVQASSGGILVESFASSAGGPHPAVLILTEARGLAHPPMMKSDGSLARLISIPTLCMCFPSMIWRPSSAPEAPAPASAIIRNGNRIGSQPFTAWCPISILSPVMSGGLACSAYRWRPDQLYACPLPLQII